MPGYHAKKRLGQNFLKSREIIERIVELVAPTQGDSIIEIGPGRGSLTLPLAESGASITAVEFDRDVIGYLEKLLRKWPNAKIVNQDFLSFDPGEAGEGPHKLIGNLPYNITSPALAWVTENRKSVHRAVFMVQKEVGQRVAASPGNKNWSPLSIFTQLSFDVHLCFDVAPEHFQPPPKVTSCVIELTPIKKPVAVVHEQLFERVVRTGFRQRRKLLSNNLAPDLLPDTGSVRKLLAQAGLAEDVRAEEVSIAGFLKLTECLAVISMP
ncbi:MAG: 16S rRNA (adenine(1518)-N(6)/adenine(1519)-N(6))-dimethyltransferase RsmA [candidate division Zixibacteria bacterium]|nr:16S rRNA (adenine(1518)-N(6)/adenine(1519)-N(6))-dimethyltransferase RsmA [candidate division Zixibacteria bacterium]